MAALRRAGEQPVEDRGFWNRVYDAAAAVNWNKVAKASGLVILAIGAVYANLPAREQGNGSLVRTGLADRATIMPADPTYLYMAQHGEEPRYLPSCLALGGRPFEYVDPSELVEINPEFSEESLTYKCASIARMRTDKSRGVDQIVDNLLIGVFQGYERCKEIVLSEEQKDRVRNNIGEKLERCLRNEYANKLTDVYKKMFQEGKWSNDQIDIIEALLEGSLSVYGHQRLFDDFVAAERRAIFPIKDTIAEELVKDGQELIGNESIISAIIRDIDETVSKEQVHEIVVAALSNSTYPSFKM